MCGIMSLSRGVLLRIEGDRARCAPGRTPTHDGTSPGVAGIACSKYLAVPGTVMIDCRETLVASDKQLDRIEGFFMSRRP